MIKRSTKKILSEIDYVLSRTDEKEVSKFIDAITQAKHIVCAGAGRVGSAIWGFAMRLGHLGVPAHTIGDSTLPSLTKKDLLIVASGSGETETIYHYVNICKKKGVPVALITGNPESRMGKLADFMVTIHAPNKYRPLKNFKSIQPMTTLNEQALQIFFDAVVLDLMKKTRQTEKHLWQRHSILE